MTRSDNINDLAAALASAQGEIEGAEKGSENPYFRHRYADLASVWGAIRAPLAKYGLAVAQPVAIDGSAVTVTTLLLHASGQWIASDLTMVAQRQIKDGGGWEQLNSPQAIGSVITYARRYALAAMVGVAPEDDDAETAEGRGGNYPARGRKTVRETEPATQEETQPAQPKTLPKLPSGRELPDELNPIYRMIHADPKRIIEAFHSAENALVAKAGANGIKEYERVCAGYRSEHPKGTPVSVPVVMDALLDLWLALQTVERASADDAL